MRLSEFGLNFIKEFEGYHDKLPNGDCRAYRRSSGVCVLGYGCTDGVKLGMIWTQKQAEEALLKELAWHENNVTLLVKTSLTQNMYDALVSFSYNCGMPSLINSEIVRRINAEDYEGAAKAFGMDVKDRGHLLSTHDKRRATEAELFLTPSKDVRTFQHSKAS
ncbi:MAG: lysozyme [Hyphomicrobium sp.]